jgi:hypothetical protein
MIGVGVLALIVKSTIFTTCAGELIWVLLPFALAVPDTVTWVTTGLVVLLVVTLIWTEAGVVLTPSVEMVQGTISFCPSAVEQDPVPAVSVPVGGDESDANPVFGSTVA